MARTLGRGHTKYQNTCPFVPSDRQRNDQYRQRRDKSLYHSRRALTPYACSIRSMSAEPMIFHNSVNGII